MVVVVPEGQKPSWLFLTVVDASGTQRTFGRAGDRAQREDGEVLFVWYRNDVFLDDEKLEP